MTIIMQGYKGEMPFKIIGGHLYLIEKEKLVQVEFDIKISDIKRIEAIK